MNIKEFSFRPVLMIVLGIALLAVACTQVEDKTRSGSLLVVESVQGEPGGQGGESGDVLLSDVCDNADDLPQDPEFCTVFNDNATVGFSNEYLQIGPGSGAGAPSFLNDIIVDQYRVDYLRPNNRNTPGIDVPFPIDGKMNARIDVNAIGSASIVVVRHEAKREPPLSELAFGFGEGVITATAQMQFFGSDIAGHAVSALGYLEIQFANYGEGN